LAHAFAGDGLRPLLVGQFFEPAWKNVAGGIGYSVESTDVGEKLLQLAISEMSAWWSPEFRPTKAMSWPCSLSILPTAVPIVPVPTTMTFIACIPPSE
jgi:hypothetical protein